jgi:cation-transporting P-type ATPase E
MSDDVTPPRDPAAGLTWVEVAERVARGQTNRFTETTSHSIWVIFRDNVFTLFDAVIIALLVAVLTSRRYADALFGFVIVMNTEIGIAQELRAKRALDRISLLTAPRVRVVRDGSVAEAPITEIVLGDVIELMSGDQAPVDGETLVSDALEIDEALLTGESAPIRKAPGDRVLSGSIVVAGAGASARPQSAATRTPAESPPRLGSSGARRPISWPARTESWR